jgi:hypothetical protein
LGGLRTLLFEALGRETHLNYHYTLFIRGFSMIKIAKLFGLIFLSFTTVSVFAAELEIVSCNSEAPGHGNSERGTIKLSVDDSGNLIARVGPMGGTLDTFHETKINAAEVFKSDMEQRLAEINSLRDTGIKPTDVKQFQYVLIAGNSDFPTALYKLFDSQGNTLGWLTQFGAFLSGCYPN